MTARKPPTNYGQLAARFGTVRRAWKRAAALSGLAVVATESIGILTALLFLDWLYQPLPLVRIGMWAVALLGIAYLFARHVLKPLLRKIPDEQIALYMEENRRELDGVLITAVEYGQKRDNASGNQAALIDAVIDQAADRSGRTKIGHIVDLGRLKKYGLGALAGIGLYIVLGVFFPNTFGYHMERVLQPWNATAEDLAKHEAAEEMAAPLRFSLSKGNVSLPRGSSFDFEVTLSKPKPAETPVQLYFRTRASGGAWQQLAMTEIEKLNGFQGAIPDVSENMEFYVGCGQDKSDTYQITVFDPLVVQSMEMKVHYPDYVKQPDDIQRPFAGDLTALVGSTATLRILTSTPLKEGEIKWSNGQTQSVSVDPQSTSTAVVSFEVKENATYDFSLTDVNGQQAASAAPLSVQALPDTPPTITVKSPQSPTLTQPLGEIDFVAEAGDDFGVAGVDLVYSLLDDKGEAHETRVPLKLDPSDDKDVPHAVDATYRFSLEDMNPLFKPDDAISYHLEARDGKGQVTSTPIGFILIGYFEDWAVWGGKEAFSLHMAGPDLLSLLNTTWQLDSKKLELAAPDFQKQSQDIAGKLVGGDGKPNDFLHVAKFPHLARVANIVNAHIMKAHDALVAADTPTAIAQLSTAVALVAGGQLKEDTVAHLDDQVLITSNTGGVPAMTVLELNRIKALAAQAAGKTHQEDNTDAAKKAADMAKKIEALRQQQSNILAKAAANAPTDGKKPASGNGAAAAAAKPDLAAAEHDLANQARAAAEEAKGQGQGKGGANNAKMQDATNKTNEAARLMEEAARAFMAGKIDEGQAKADQAKNTLAAAGEVLHATDRDKLEAAISDAARHASVLLEKQQDLSAETGTLATDLGTNKPDQRQQRDLQAQSYQQTVLGADGDTLASEINDLNQLAAQVGEPESIRALAEAQRIIKRSPPQAKMSDAVIDLNNGTPAAAGADQKDAETSLAKIVESLQAGSDSLAANSDAELARANRAANEAKNGIAALQAKAAGQGKGDQAKAQGKGDQAQANGKGDQAQAQGKGDQAQGQGKGDQAQAQGKGDQAQAQAEAQAGNQNPTDAQGNASGGGDDVRQVAYDINQLTTVIEGRQLVPDDQAAQLKAMAMDKAELEKRLAVDPKFLQDVSSLVSSISDKLEQEIEAKAQAGKLFSSQREECPPKYRQLVNKYFEALSQLAPATTPAATPGATGQPQ